MRCPKCRYISFGAATKCRNCGYDFSLSEETPSFDLPIQPASAPVGPMGDLPLSASAKNPDPQPPATVEKNETVPPARAGVARFDLPLFAGDDTPLVSPPAVPRAPLSVRRGAPAVARQRQEPATADGQPSPGDEPQSRSQPKPVIRRRPDADTIPESEANASPGIVTAPVFRRLVAGVIDVLIVGGIDLGVLYFTLRVLGLQTDSIWLLPVVPLAAFLMLLNGGYFVLFTTAGGQTIGKMSTGIRVVSPLEDGRVGRVGFGTAVVRAASYLASLLPAGLGFAPILFTPEGRTIHDRLADTRVVRA